MPTTYTHDLFGKQVYRQLDKNIQKIIRPYKNLYRIGLHGPDILFYYMVSKNPVSSYGVKMHKSDAADFFERSIRKARDLNDRELLAYLFGFGCHYILDSRVHPYVNRMAKDHVISHTTLEKEFDRFLMEKSGKDPLTYRPSDAIVPRRHYAGVIHRAMPAIKETNLWISLHMMKFLTNLMVCNDNGRRKKVIEKILHTQPVKRGREFSEFFMAPVMPDYAKAPVIEMNRYYEEALQEAAEVLEELYMLYEYNQELGERWHRTYNG